MKKSKKRLIVCIVTMVVLAMSFVACSSDKKTENNFESETNSEVPTHDEIAKVPTTEVTTETPSEVTSEAVSTEVPTETPSEETKPSNNKNTETKPSAGASDKKEETKPSDNKNTETKPSAGASDKKEETKPSDDKNQSSESNKKPEETPPSDNSDKNASNSDKKEESSENNETVMLQPNDFDTYEEYMHAEALLENKNCPDFELETGKVYRYGDVKNCYALTHHEDCGDMWSDYNDYLISSGCRPLDDNDFIIFYSTGDLAENPNFDEQCEELVDNETLKEIERIRSKGWDFAGHFKTGNYYMYYTMKNVN